MAWADYDNDGDLDHLYVANTFGANQLFRNDGNGSFTDVTSGPARWHGPKPGRGMGRLRQRWRPGSLCEFSGGSSKLFRNAWRGGFVDVTTGPLVDVGIGEGSGLG